MKLPVGLPIISKTYERLIVTEKMDRKKLYQMVQDGTYRVRTEAEYFEEVMKPEGWEKDITGWHYFDYEDEEDGTVIIDYDAGVFLETETPSITKSVHKLLGCALDHYEALQAIRKFEQE